MHSPCADEIKPEWKLRFNIILGVIIALVLILLFAVDFGRVMDTPVVTLDEYNKIIPGMSYSAVCSIIGEDGQEHAESFTPGIPGVQEPVTATKYVWRNKDGSHAEVTFQNDQVVNKEQFELR